MTPDGARRVRYRGAVDLIGRQEPARKLLVAVVALQLVVGLIAALAVSPPRADADDVGATVPLFKTADAPQPFKTLTNPTWEGVPLVLHVLEDRGPWLLTRINTRPNGSTAWVRRADVKLRRMPNRILIELGERRLTVLRGNDVLAQHRVGIGTARTPTPLGEFYVDATVNIANPNGPYGVGQLSVSGFSDVPVSYTHLTLPTICSV